ncbi:MAG: response regulator, partial [Flavobacteriales bacterium]
MNKKINILLVEDEKELAISTLNFLKENNYNCFHAPDVKSAILLIKKHSFSTVLLDLGLPDGDGLFLIKV